MTDRLEEKRYRNSIKLCTAQFTSLLKILVTKIQAPRTENLTQLKCAVKHTHTNMRAHATYPLIEIATVNVDAVCVDVLYIRMAKNGIAFVGVYACVCVCFCKYKIPLASIFSRLERCFCYMWLLLPFISSVYITVYRYILIIHQRIVCECMKCDSAAAAAAAVLCGRVYHSLYTHKQRENSCFCQHITR